MTRDELINILGEIEGKIRSGNVQDFFMNRPQPERDAFVKLRQDVTLLADDLRNARLGNIAERLDQLSAEFNEGIDDLNGKIRALNDAVAIMDILAKVINLAVRIAALAA